MMNLNKKGLNSSYCCHNIVSKSKRLNWAAHVASIEDSCNFYKTLTLKPMEKMSLLRSDFKDNNSCLDGALNLDLLLSIQASVLTIAPSKSSADI